MTSQRKSAAGPAGNVWKFFTSVKLTVFVLLILAATSVIGTLIPQNAAQAFYLQKYGEVFSRLFNTLDFVDMYHSWWFLLLLGVLAVNIIVCSVDRLKSSWKIIFPARVTWQADRFTRLKTAVEFNMQMSEEQLVTTCRHMMSGKNKGVEIREENPGTALFRESGRWTRLGVYVVHLSVLFMLVGAVIGSVWGYKGFVNIVEGETADTVNVRREGHAHIPLGFQVRCNAFSVSFYDTGQPQEFRSSLTIIEKGQEMLTTDVIVNDPLRYRGISFYQSSYGTASASSARLTFTSRESGMQYEKNVGMGQSIPLPESGGRFVLDRFVNTYPFRGHNLGEGFVGRVIDAEGREKEVFISVRFPTFDKMRQGKFAFAVADFDKKFYTGLQVTRDPGVWWVYSGFILMIIGCWITFFMSHQQTFVYIQDREDGGSRVLVSGKSNRNPQGMKIKVEKFAEKIKGLK